MCLEVILNLAAQKYNYSHIKINDKEKEIKLNYFTVFVLSKKKIKITH